MRIATKVAFGTWVLAAGCALAAVGVTEGWSQTASDDSSMLAFPGAIGFGAHSKGGRGGRVIYVTTLADSGRGSLRACIDAKGPRICVFRVSGLIRFTTGSPFVRNPYLTIAGQTAPGAGITISHAGGELGVTPMVVKNTHDVVIRHIRVRLDTPGEARGSNDAFTIENSDNVILDHVSGSWAADENVNPYGDNDNITISWSVFAEGIPKHDKCALLGGNPSGPQHLSFIGNLCAHNGDRNPDINFEPGSCVEVINNVLYDAQSQFAEVWESYGGSPVSIVGNVFRAGPSTKEEAVGIDLSHTDSHGPSQVYAADNKFEGKFVYFAPDFEEFRADAPPCPLTVTPVTPDEAYSRVLDEAGTFPRDPTDARIVHEVKKSSGKIREAAGQIEMPAVFGAPYPDEDHDGMDDVWESANGADPKAADSWSDANGDGLSNLDAFLDYLHLKKLGMHDAD